jgi:hypothetical protein
VFECWGYQLHYKHWAIPFCWNYHESIAALHDEIIDIKGGSYQINDMIAGERESNESQTNNWPQNGRANAQKDAGSVSSNFRVVIPGSTGETSNSLAASRACVSNGEALQSLEIKGDTMDP